MTSEKIKLSKILADLHPFCQIWRKCLCFGGYGLIVFFGIAWSVVPVISVGLSEV
jgi:heme exporter protein D